MTTHSVSPPTVSPEPVSAASATTLTPTARQLWRRGRWFLAVAAIVLLAGLLLGGLGDSTAYPSLDPRSADPDGAKATAQLLRAQGITVDTTADPGQLAAPARDDTVLLPLPDLLTDDQLTALAAAGHRRLVLISPDSTALGLLAPGVRVAETAGLPLSVSSANAAQQCTLPEAAQAGSAELGGLLYRTDGAATGCYPRNGYPALARTTTASGTEVIVLGSGLFLTNQHLSRQGNAALALGLLGAQPHLTWFLPDYQALPPAEQQKSLTDLIPDGWRWAGVQLALATVLAALWRARRLGPVVGEELPVVVRAAETTEGRARLYHRAKARGRAAEALRRAARHRLAPVLGVPLAAGEPAPTALLTALADRLGDPREPGGLHGLLYGPPPTDDAALLRLADDLDALERQVRHP
ncbi:DUF4350 domain-containing protein [Kitasatospora sp. NPDC008050]|uniref:DUF4350 domain-containing protein n=1 Tax=Kitasatospora sp. NPDC008050 TaxID=3364021 RepID=UPI0036EFE419